MTLARFYGRVRDTRAALPNALRLPVSAAWVLPGRKGAKRNGLAALLMVLLLVGENAMAVEEAKYTVLQSDDAFEVRRYEPHVVAETLVSGDFEDAGNQAFGRLFKYISGHNAGEQKIAMTSPVGQSAPGQKIAMTSPVGQQQRDGQWVVSFMMPATFTADTTPAPKDPQVRIRLVPAHTMAAVRYSGFWSEKAYRRNLDALQSWIAANGFAVQGEPVWARYNSPFAPWFLRRNEILMPIAAPEMTD